MHLTPREKLDEAEAFTQSLLGLAGADRDDGEAS